jgi:hypothetical protein
MVACFLSFNCHSTSANFGFYVGVPAIEVFKGTYVLNSIAVIVLSCGVKQLSKELIFFRN